MIHPHLLSSSAHPPLTESQKQVWKTAIRNQPSKVKAYRRTPVENYNLLQTNELEFFFNVEKIRNKIAYLTAFFFLGLKWRFGGIDLVSAGALIFVIWQHAFREKTLWNLRVSATGLSVAFHDEHYSRLEIPFQQIICMDFEAYFDAENNHSTELVIYYAAHKGGYLTQRVAIVGNEANTMGIIHYFLNQYQNAIPQKP
jgi:hypothetical protein